MQLSRGSIGVNLTELSRGRAIALEALLQKYQSVFQAPTTLPPPRSHDHRIPLEPGNNPVSVRPYRYPHIQKNEIDKAVKEMLSTGIIVRISALKSYCMMLCMLLCMTLCMT